ncbi:MAG: histidine--tRNA ligase [Thermodesulfobacteriota bacterium]
MIQIIRGFKDILPGETELWQHIEICARSLFENFGFKEIRIPILEKTELFARSIGEDTDIVEKEMYTFEDRKGEKITLRPEATASIVRSLIQHGLYTKNPVQKLYTIGPMFRRERPQKGRYRQFYQINAEIFGVGSALADAELIFILMTLFSRLSVKNTEAHINSLGCRECRPIYKEALNTHLDDFSSMLCPDCVRRKSRNPLRVLDCKVPSCRLAMENAPAMVDFLCDDCNAHFEETKQALEMLKIPFILDRNLVRGLDYYTRTTFEIQTSVLGAQNAVAGGGRYDGLVQALGGPQISATGFAIGFDRLIEVSDLDRDSFVKSPHLFIAALGEKSRMKAFEWSCRLGEKGIRTEMELGKKGLKSQMKQADRLNAGFVIIMGEDELSSGSVVLKDMKTSIQEQIPITDVVDAVMRRCI